MEALAPPSVFSENSELNTVVMRGKNSPCDATSKKAKVRPTTAASFVLDDMAGCGVVRLVLNFVAGMRQERQFVFHFIEVLAGWPSQSILF